VHSVARRCESSFPGKGAPLSQLWRAKQLEYTWQRSLMQRYAPFSQVTREALEYSCAALGLRFDESLLQEYLKLAPFPEARAALARLPGRKAILSNGSPDMLDPLVRDSGLAFDAVLSVDSLKVYKPAPQVYQFAVAKLGVPKEGIGFVSSNCWDALGAKAFGFNAFWINRTGAPLDRLGVRPDAVLKSLGELSEVLR
jgi:2-haloacid dehalogenase